MPKPPKACPRHLFGTFWPVCQQALRQRDRMKKLPFANAKEKAKRGRPTLCTPALIEKICELLADANTIAASCESLGIGVSTFHEWRQRNPDFADATTRARAKARIKLIKEIKRHSADDWRGWAWLAERMFPNEFAKTVDREIPIADTEKRGFTVCIGLDTGGKTLKELMNFPVVPTGYRLAQPTDPQKVKGEKIVGDHRYVPIDFEPPPSDLADDADEIIDDQNNAPEPAPENNGGDRRLRGRIRGGHR